jgi:hypothetical protein
VEIVLRTETPDGITVVLAAIVHAKIIEEHAAVADLALIDRTIRRPTSAAGTRAGAANGSSAWKAVSGSWQWSITASLLHHSDRFSADRPPS